MRPSDKLLRDDLVIVLDGIRKDQILLPADRQVLAWIEAGEFHELFSPRAHPQADLIAWLHVIGCPGLASKAAAGHYSATEADHAEYEQLLAASRVGD